MTEVTLIIPKYYCKYCNDKCCDKRSDPETICDDEFEHYYRKAKHYKDQYFRMEKKLQQYYSRMTAMEEFIEKYTPDSFAAVRAYIQLPSIP